MHIAIGIYNVTTKKTFNRGISYIYVYTALKVFVSSRGAVMTPIWQNVTESATLCKCMYMAAHHKFTCKNTQ